MGTSNKTRTHLIRLGILSLLVVFLVMSWPLIQERYFPDVPALEQGQALQLTPEEIPATLTPNPTASLPAEPLQTGSLFAPSGFHHQGGIWILSIREGLFSHLFAYHPTTLDFTRLTYGEWNDEAPAISPDGEWIAFSSDRDGFWDIYLLEIQTGEVSRITNSPEYDGNPSWSPDSLWLAHDTYLDDSLEIIIRPVDGRQEMVRLTDEIAADYDPAWSPGGRDIAFVSTRSGEREIWIANLDRIDNRFRNISLTNQRADEFPVWSPDGKALIWSGTEDGTRGVYRWEPGQPNLPARYIGLGDYSAWSPDGSQVAAHLSLPNASYVTAFSLDGSRLYLPPVASPGQLNGIAWGDISLPDPPPAAYLEAAGAEPTPLWVPTRSEVENLPEGRGHLIQLEDVDAPYPALQDSVDESFSAMRTALAEQIGWDYLASLENAFIPLTTPALPSLDGSWLYTGRAIAVNSVPMNAGWLVAARENFGSQTFWRIYVRARLQDGSQGKPITEQTWDFSARYTGDPRGYEEGGLEISNPPGGYWLDFTSLAGAYGWERVPSVSTWRSFYPATRLNEYIFPGDLDWRGAILEIYPPEMLVTPTPVSSPTQTLTPTITPTPTKWPTRTPRPTSTPWPTRTPTPTLTATITLTPTITGTSTATPVGR